MVRLPLFGGVYKWPLGNGTIRPVGAFSPGFTFNDILGYLRPIYVMRPNMVWLSFPYSVGISAVLGLGFVTINTE